MDLNPRYGFSLRFSILSTGDVHGRAGHASGSNARFFRSRPDGCRTRNAVLWRMMHFTQQVIVLANRQPYSHARDCQGQVTVRRAGSGVVNAVEPLLTACSGVWVGHGSAAGDRDAVDDRDGVMVPPEAPAYRLRRVWLSEEEERDYYDGFANSALWPLCHRTY